MDRPVVAVVLAGGTGTRLYPASRSDRPKQFLSLLGDQSMLADTVARTDFADETYVLTRESFAAEAREHAPDAEVLVEPEGKDTGPALVYAAHRVREAVGDCVLVCLPSDHHVEGAFGAAMERAAAVAADTQSLVTAGVEPARAAPGYGYIKAGEWGDGHAPVETFVEKPDAGAAARYVHHGYLWNAGIFAWTPEAFLDAARDTELAPLVEALEEGDPEAGFAAVDAVSVDYAVLETAEDVRVVAADFAWDDVGTWDALERVLESDEDGNVAVGDALLADAEDTVVATDGHVAAVGVSDLVIASFGDRTLVVPKSRAQKVRDVVARLREDGRF
jgi:mannose-1-phosphate guanylyltransferase